MRLWWSKPVRRLTGGQELRIDVHHHFLHRDHVVQEAARLDIVHGSSRQEMLNWSAEAMLERMDRGGVDVAVGSISTPGVWFGDVAAARHLSRRWNEDGAAIVQKWPDRFGMFAVVAPPDADGALAEIEHALDILKADGISIFTNYDGKYPGDPAFAPVFEELNRRRTIVFVHPTFSISAQALPEVLPQVIEFPFDTTRAIVSVVVNGMLDKYPDIRWIFTHAGGTIPMLAGRIDAILPRLHRKIDGRQLHVDGARVLMQRLSFDLVGSCSRGVIASLRELTPIENVLYGSDLPFADFERELEELSRSGLTEVERNLIERDNALRLLPRFSQ